MAKTRRSDAPGGPVALPAVLLLLLAAMAGTSRAADLTVPAAPGALGAALAAAAPGDRLQLQAGDHAGPILIDKPLTVIGTPGARILGSGAGKVVVIDAPDVTLRGLAISGSGLKLESEDSGIFATAQARRVRIEDNRLDDNLIGIYLKGAPEARVRANRIHGRRDLRMNERGNGIQIWNAPGAAIEGNEIRYGRDGIFVTTSRDNTFRDNDLSELRFAIHYMYTNDSRLIGNRSRGNHVGYALMYSRRLTVEDNLSAGDRDHGMLLNYANSSTFSGNAVLGGAEKCVFIYNANKNAFLGNHFSTATASPSVPTAPTGWSIRSSGAIPWPSCC
jgi:nitrous oxidase accessory protein